MKIQTEDTTTTPSNFGTIADKLEEAMQSGNPEMAGQAILDMFNTIKRLCPERVHELTPGESHIVTMVEMISVITKAPQLAVLSAGLRLLGVDLTVGVLGNAYLQDPEVKEWYNQMRARAGLPPSEAVTSGDYTSA